MEELMRFELRLSRVDEIRTRIIHLFTSWVSNQQVA